MTADRSPVAPGGRYTPGPWRVEGRFVNALKIKTVAEVPMGGVRHGKVDAENARLIASAPALFEALTNMLAEFGARLSDGKPLGHTVGSMNRALQMVYGAEAALRAARPPTEGDEP